MKFPYHVRVWPAWACSSIELAYEAWYSFPDETVDRTMFTEAIALFKDQTGLNLVRSHPEECERILIEDETDEFLLSQFIMEWS